MSRFLHAIHNICLFHVLFNSEKVYTCTHLISSPFNEEGRERSGVRYHVLYQLHFVFMYNQFDHLRGRHTVNISNTHFIVSF